MYDDTVTMEQISLLRGRISELEAKVKSLQSYVWTLAGYATFGAVGVIFLWVG